MKEKIIEILKKNHLHHYGNFDEAVKELNKFLNEENIIKIVKESFDNNISSTASETILGIESSIEGKEDFLKEIEERLKGVKE